MIIVTILAALLLPIAAAYSWRMSPLVSSALGLATVTTAAYLVVPWDGSRWLTAGLTGIIGAVALGWRVREHLGPRALLQNRAAWASALLVGSSVADFVSLYREAHGEQFGALPILQCAVLLVIIALSRKPIE